MDKRTCNDCKVEKPLTDFSKSKSRKLGYQYTCKNCNNARAKRWYLNNVDKAKDRIREWKKNNPDKAYKYMRNSGLNYWHGITENEYQIMFTAQNGKCYLCGNSQKKPLLVDHNHSTKKIRKLLCFRCNHLIGAIENNLGLLEIALQYIRL